LKLLRDHVLIEHDRKKTISDIIELPDDTTILPPACGKVIEVGPKVVEVAVGDTVHFERFDWNVAQGERIIISEDEILAIEK
jgi:co-chaperonin GroES (HSP10)